MWPKCQTKARRKPNEYHATFLPHLRFKSLKTDGTLVGSVSESHQWHHNQPNDSYGSYHCSAKTFMNNYVCKIRESCRCGKGWRSIRLHTPSMTDAQWINETVSTGARRSGSHYVRPHEHRVRAPANNIRNLHLAINTANLERNKFGHIGHITMKTDYLAEIFRPIRAWNASKPPYYGV